MKRGNQLTVRQLLDQVVGSVDDKSKPVYIEYVTADPSADRTKGLAVLIQNGDQLEAHPYDDSRKSIGWDIPLDFNTFPADEGCVERYLKPDDLYVVTDVDGNDYYAYEAITPQKAKRLIEQLTHEKRRFMLLHCIVQAAHEVVTGVAPAGNDLLKLAVQCGRGYNVKRADFAEVEDVTVGALVAEFDALLEKRG